MYLEFDVQAERPQGRRSTRAATRRGAARLSAVVKTLVLAYQIEEAIGDGRARGYAEIARQMDVSRARVSQIVKYLALAPAIQEALLLDDSDRFTKLSCEKLRAIAGDPNPESQLARFQFLLT